MTKRITTVLLPIFGFLFLTAYIRNAAVNVVYTDYIRLVNSYLHDVFSFSPYMHADIFTRIPVNYFERIINVVLFRYSTMFDMFLGIASLTVSSFIMAKYCQKKEIKTVTVVLILVLMFSLNKWEMLTNGSGWVHFAALALFYYNFCIYDRIKSGSKKRRDELKLFILPWIIILFFAGPYCAVYAGVLILFYLHDVLTDIKCGSSSAIKTDILRIFCVFLPFALYLFSKINSVEEYAGATSLPVFTVISQKPLLIPLLFIQSFASMILGEGSVTFLNLPVTVTLILGVFVIALYVYAFRCNFKTGLYKTDPLPLMLLVYGLASHIIVCASRWIFLNDRYGMSSRYALQFEAGIIGIVLTLAMMDKKLKPDEKPVLSIKSKRKKTKVRIITLILLAGSLYTTGTEIRIAPYRKENFIRMKEAVLSYEVLSDEELKDILGYHDPVRIRLALGLLKEKKLNVFSQTSDPEL